MCLTADCRTPNQLSCRHKPRFCNDLLPSCGELLESQFANRSRRLESPKFQYLILIFPALIAREYLHKVMSVSPGCALHSSGWCEPSPAICPLTSCFFSGTESLDSTPWKLLPVRVPARCYLCSNKLQKHPLIFIFHSNPFFDPPPSVSPLVHYMPSPPLLFLP